MYTNILANGRGKEGTLNIGINRERTNGGVKERVQFSSHDAKPSVNRDGGSPAVRRGGIHAPDDKKPLVRECEKWATLGF